MKKEKIKTWWDEKEINDLELLFLHQMFDCTTQEGVDVAYSYAKYLSKQTMSSDNYPLFLKLFSTGNHWIVDALLNGREAESFFKVVQPNSFIVTTIMKMLTRFKPGEMYSKLYLVLLGILNIAYENPVEGFRLCPLSAEDVNNIGKQLDKVIGQKDPVNKAVLHLLDRIADLIGNIPLADKNSEQAAHQANKIRGKFLDESKGLDEAIPVELLKKGDYKKNEIKPSGAA